MLKQSALEEGTAATIWGLITRGAYVDLGSYHALLHKHDLNRDLGLALTFSGASSHLSAKMTFRAVTDIDAEGHRHLEDSAILSEVTYQFLSNDEPMIEATLQNDQGSWWDTHLSIGNVSRSHKVLAFDWGRRFLPELKLIELEHLIERYQDQLSEQERGLVRERARVREVERDEQRAQFQELARMSPQELSQLPPTGSGHTTGSGNDGGIGSRTRTGTRPIFGCEP